MKYVLYVQHILNYFHCFFTSTIKIVPVQTILYQFKVFCPSSKTNCSKVKIELQQIYTSTLHVSVYIHHYSPPLRGIVVYYFYLLFHRSYSTKVSKAKAGGLKWPVVRMTEIILYRKGDCRLNYKTETRYKTESK